jgi:hypothetical protein
MRSLLFVGGGILIGAGLTWAEAQFSAEKRAREHYHQQLESHKRVMNLSQTLNEQWVSEAPVKEEHDLTVGGEMVVEQPIQEAPPEYVQAYVEQANQYADPDTFVQEASYEFISEDDYAEDDGRAKEIIQVFMGEGEPYYVQDGMVIEDWAEKIGPNILVAFYQQFPPEFKGDRVLYVRNNQLDEDYEVSQESGP